jgi:hypothetical protein
LRRGGDSKPKSFNRKGDKAPPPSMPCCYFFLSLLSNHKAHKKQFDSKEEKKLSGEEMWLGNIHPGKY